MASIFYGARYTGDSTPAADNYDDTDMTTITPRKFYAESARIYLRDFTIDDRLNLFDLDSDPAVVRFVGGKPSTMEHIDEVMVRIMGYRVRYDGKFGIWVAHEKATGEFMGWFHLRPNKKTPDDIKNLELGYRLKQKFWRKGYATEMSRVLVDKAFREFGAESVFAHAHADNHGSTGVMKKVGMTLTREYIETELPEGDQRAVIYTLTRAAWEHFQN